jgi:diguanylate cyclase (GGDEF)-like protein
LTKSSPRRARAPEEETQAQNSLAIWLRLQRSLAENNGVTLCTVSRDGAVIGRIENDNSVCKAMRSSAEHSRLCANDCTSAYTNALSESAAVNYRCHAGLECFALPVRVGDQQLVIMGGRAFTSTAEYTEFIARYNDLEAVRSGECLKNVTFASQREITEAAELVASTASYHFQGARRAEPDEKPTDSKPEASLDLLDAHLEIIRLSDELESKKRASAQFYDFLRSVASTLDSQKIYPAVLAKFNQILRSERSSLMIFNEDSNELALEAAVGADFEATGPIRIKLGESVAGAVLASGVALVVRDVDSDARVTGERKGQYKSKSFVSYPIVIGPRKIGVLNVTDRTDGTPYESEDLSMLELMAPHLALIIERTEWHRKAETFQRMSLTDPLTGLPNRRYLEERLFEEVERSKRYGTPLSFLIIDIDHFKRYNDLYGHTNADIVLVKTAQMLRRSVRTIDMSARFAGDEFCIVMPETEQQAASHIAERLRRAVGGTEYRSEQDEQMGEVTLSIGVSSFSATRQSPLSIIETADRALYQAKMRGRNCVAVYEESATTR